METAKKSTIVIIGAGITGCFLAILLAKRGYSVAIYEKTSEDDVRSFHSKKSFNITLFDYAEKILTQEGLWDAIQPEMLSLTGAMTQVTPYSKPVYRKLDPQKAHYTVSRAKLLDLLLKQAMKYKKITFHFDTTLLSLNRQEKTLFVEDNKTKKQSLISCEVVLGADGVHSLVRSFLQQGQETRHTQEYSSWSYKQVALPASLVTSLHLPTKSTYTAGQKYAVFIAFPQEDGSLASLFLLPQDKEHGFSRLKTAVQVKQFIAANFPQLLPALPEVVKAFTENPESRFVTIHTSPWFYKDFLVLLGDSAHGFMPFFGQGISAAFGDCLALVRLIDTYGKDWGKIFSLYEKERKIHMDTLGELSKQGFVRSRRYKKADYIAICDTFVYYLSKLFPRYILPSLSAAIDLDPDHTADHAKSYAKQTRLLNVFGLGILAWGITAVISLQEKITTLFKKQ